MRSTHFIVLAVMMLLAGVPTAALAQPATPAKQERQQARQHFDEAESHKRKGDEHAAHGEQDAAREAYDRAAEAYTKAFELYKHPAFIYNLAQMRRLRGERQRAIRAYETFLVLEPDGPQSATARDFIVQLTLELDAEASRPAPAPTTPETPEPGGTTEPAPAPPPDATPAPAPSTGPTGPTGPEPGPDSAATGGASPAADPLAISDTRPDPARGRGLRIAGVVSLAAGAVGLGLGVKLGLDARAASQELSDKPAGEPWGDDDRRRLARGEDAERNMFIALGAGSAAVIAGGVLYTLGVASGEGKHYALQPRATGDGFLVHLSGTF